MTRSTPPSKADAGDADGVLRAALCAALRGEKVPLSRPLVELARVHRVHLILAHGRVAGIADEGIRAVLSAELREAAIADLFRERELTRLVRRLAAAGVGVLLLKGAALAYSLYPAPQLRPRADLDVLIARNDLAAAERVLLAAGWLHAPEQSHDAVMTQRHYALGGNPSCAEHLDLHWKIAVPHVFGDALGFEELARRGVTVAGLGAGVRTLSPPDALFLACLHRVAHHQDSADLLWLWDIHLLTRSLTEEERKVFVALAATRSMRAVCARGMELALESFATPGAGDLAAALRPPQSDPPEPSASFLGGGMREVDRLRSDLGAVAGWGARLTLVSAHLFPGRDYVRSLYPRWPAAALPLAYLHRALRGAPGWFRRPAE